MSDVKWDEIQPLEVSQEAIEQCILLLQKAGWMQEHDRLLTEGKTGRWLYYLDNGQTRCKCSECLTSYGCLDTPYCPNCGAKMK